MRGASMRTGAWLVVAPMGFLLASLLVLPLVGPWVTWGAIVVAIPLVQIGCLVLTFGLASARATRKLAEWPPRTRGVAVALFGVGAMELPFVAAFYARAFAVAFGVILLAGAALALLPPWPSRAPLWQRRSAMRVRLRHL